MTTSATGIDGLNDVLSHKGPVANVAEMAAAKQKTIAYFAGMPQATRRKLAAEIMRLHKLAISQLGDMAAHGTRHIDAAQTSIALVATATLSELRKLRWWYPSAAACRALADRRPDWLSDGIELLLERTTSSLAIGDVAQELNRLVAQGHIEPPRHGHYAIGIAFAYAFNPTLPPLIDRVRADIHRLAPAIWRQFEVEGGGEISLANFDKFFAESGSTWGEALKVLSDEGRLDRQGLLDASLDALNRGFSQYRAGWFSRFHESLSPAIDERIHCSGRYLDPLASPIGPTVSLAMTALKAIDNVGRLDAEEVIAHIEPALHVKTAATVKSAIHLLAKAAKFNPRVRCKVLRLAAIGLEHSKSEIQTAALNLIEHNATALDEASRAAIAERLEIVVAPLRSRVQTLLGHSGAISHAGKFEDDAATLRHRAMSLPADLRRLAGVDKALAALNGEVADIARAPFNGMDIPRLDPAKRIEPIATFESLVDESLIAIEHPDDLDRVEKVLAGALRFAADRPSNARQLLAPLAKSLKRFRIASQGELATPRGSIFVVLSALLDDEPAQIAVGDDNPCAVILLRSMAMAAAIRGRQQIMQLSVPTHAGHWIDPLILVERSLARPANDTPVLLGLADQILALLRLAPDRRASALKAATIIEDEWGAALRYALGGDEPIGTTKPLWVAAARARAPFGDDVLIAELTGLSAPGLDLAPSFAYTTLRRQGGWLQIGLSGGSNTKPVGFGKDGYTFMPPRSSVPATPERCFPTRALADPAALGRLDTYVLSDGRHRASWGASPLWPQNPEPVFALSALAACMVDGNNYVKPANEPLAEGLKVILNPDVPAGPMALLMLCRGLNAIDKATGQATVDALIALIEDGRIDGRQLGEAMHQLLMSGLVVAKRWPDRLRDVARSSPLALLTVQGALERALHPGAPKRKHFATCMPGSRHYWSSRSGVTWRLRMPMLAKVFVFTSTVERPANRRRLCSHSRVWARSVRARMQRCTLSVTGLKEPNDGSRSGPAQKSVVSLRQHISFRLCDFGELGTLRVLAG
jgi:hypothetical protein